jgi:hypothetical protein
LPEAAFFSTRRNADWIELISIVGRPKGSRNRIKADLSQMIMNGAAAAGFLQLDEKGKRIATGVDGIDGYLLWCAVNEPKTYMAMLCRVIAPKRPGSSHFPQLRGSALSFEGLLDSSLKFGKELA